MNDETTIYVYAESATQTAVNVERVGENYLNNAAYIIVSTNNNVHNRDMCRVIVLCCICIFVVIVISVIVIH